MKTPAYKRTEGLHFAQVGDEFYLTLENRDVVAAINGPAFAVLENLDGFSTLSPIAKALAKAARMNLKKVLDAITGITSKLAEAGILTAVERGGNGGKSFFNFDLPHATTGLPELLHVWSGPELAGGLFVSSADGDIKVIVPNVTDGPIKTCPPHTCTVPAGLFTSRTIIRTFDTKWQQNFSAFRRVGLVQFSKGG